MVPPPHLRRSGQRSPPAGRRRAARSARASTSRCAMRARRWGDTHGVRRPPDRGGHRRGGIPRPTERAGGDAASGAGCDRWPVAPRGRPAQCQNRRRRRHSRCHKVSVPRGPLRGVLRVDDAGVYWHAMLVCGHSVDRAKGAGRLTVFSRCRCLDCLQTAAAPSQAIPSPAASSGKSHAGQHGHDSGGGNSSGANHGRGGDHSTHAGGNRHGRSKQPRPAGVWRGRLQLGSIAYPARNSE
jgi:hypothetical protein